MAMMRWVASKQSLNRVKNEPRMRKFTNGPSVRVSVPFSRQVIVLNATASSCHRHLHSFSRFSQKHTECASEELNSKTRVPELLVWFLVLLRLLLSVRPRLLNLLSDYEWLPVVTCTSLTRSSLLQLRSYTKRLVLGYSAFLPNIIPQERRVATSKLNIRGMESEVQAYRDNTE